MQIGQEQAKQRWSKQGARDHFTNHLRLTKKFTAEPSDQAAGDKYDRQLQEEVDRKIARRITVRRGGLRWTMRTEQSANA